MGELASERRLLRCYQAVVALCVFNVALFAAYRLWALSAANVGATLLWLFVVRQQKQVIANEEAIERLRAMRPVGGGVKMDPVVLRFNGTVISDRNYPASCAECGKRIPVRHRAYQYGVRPVCVLLCGECHLAMVEARHAQ